MPSVPLPSVQSPITAESEAAPAVAPTAVQAVPEHETTPRFDLPDLCSAPAVFGLVLASQLLALLLTLARQPGWWAFYTDLAPTALLLLWIILTSATLLCWARAWLNRCSIRTGSALTLLLVLATIGGVSELAWWLGQGLGMGIEAEGGWFARDHWLFLSRNLAIGVLVAAPLLRYFYVLHQWRSNVRRQAESRLHALQARIRPHFLFNSMNTIAALTRSGPELAEQAVLDLADLLRAALRDGNLHIPLADELEIARVYERMERHRLGDRLRVEWRVEGLPLEAGIPCLTIQPLLENAIHHGVEPARQPGPVTVEGTCSGRVITIRVSNSVAAGPGTARPGHQIALANVAERLRLAFGNRAGLAVDAGAEQFSVTLTFPRVAAGTSAIGPS